MARLFLSSLLALGLAASLARAQESDTPVNAFGTSWNIENRQSAPGGWSYIPNYAYPGCDKYITYDTSSPYYTSVQPTYDTDGFDGTPLYKLDAGGEYVPQANKGACCGLGTASDGEALYVQAYPNVYVQRQACGPDFWPFSTAKDLRDQPGNAIQRCINSIPRGVNGNPFAGQQTPIDIRTMASSAVNDANGNVLSPGIPATTLTPIALNTGTVQSGLTFQAGSVIPIFSGGPCPATFMPTAGTWEVDFDYNTCNLEVAIGTQRFRLANFHFHNSEHTINGLYHPIETHFVHLGLDSKGKPDATKPLVLGAFLTTGTHKNFFLERLITNFNNPATRAQTININPYEFLLPVKTSYWHYRGSLTTPPCQTADGAFVRWFLFKKPIVVSWQQSQFLSQYFNDLKKSYNAQNNRPVNAILPSTKVYSYGPNLWP